MSPTSIFHGTGSVDPPDRDMSGRVTGQKGEYGEDGS